MWTWSRPPGGRGELACRRGGGGRRRLRGDSYRLPVRLYQLHDGRLIVPVDAVFLRGEGVGQKRVAGVPAGVPAVVVDRGVVVSGAAVEAFTAGGDTGVPLTSLGADGGGEAAGARTYPPFRLVGDRVRKLPVDALELFREPVGDAAEGPHQLGDPFHADAGSLGHSRPFCYAGGVCSTAPSMAAWIDHSHSPSALASIVNELMLHLPWISPPSVAWPASPICNEKSTGSSPSNRANRAATRSAAIWPEAENVPVLWPGILLPHFEPKTGLFRVGLLRLRDRTLPMADTSSASMVTVPR